MLVYISAFASPHTMPFGVESATYYSRVVFINTMPLTEERKRMGYDVKNDKIEIYNLSDEPQKCKDLIDSATDVILAGTDFHLISNRIANKKNTYIAHERIFKKGLIKWLDPRTWKLMKFCRSVREKPVYLLAVGIPSAKDFSLLGFKKDKIFSFGYFPEMKQYLEEELERSGDGCNVLWVGRFVDFKRPLFAVKAFEKMPPQYKLTMIGDGKFYEETKAYVKKRGVNVEFLGNIPNSLVREKMLSADILLSTSHRGEGWGAVINEGMNCGCAVVCAKAIGCAGSLANEENSVIFKTNSVKDLKKALIFARENRERLSKAGYKTVMEEYNPSVAACRFAELARGNAAENGVCSKIY